MPDRRELDGIGVLITRPALQADNLCQRITELGGQAIRFPLLRIVDNSDSPQVDELLRDPAIYDLAIFISTNAVEYGISALQRHGGLAEHTLIAAVGRSTARELEKRLGRAPDLLPTARFDSEGLLALPGLQAVEGKRILIMRGNGGRELLGDTLRKRGAEVDYAEVYRREAPRPADAEAGWLEKSDILTITSGEALQNLIDFTAESQRQTLFAKPVVTVSKRVAQQAIEAGFNRVHVADSPDDEALLQAILVMTGMEQKS